MWEWNEISFEFEFAMENPLVKWGPETGFQDMHK